MRTYLALALLLSLTACQKHDTSMSTTRSNNLEPVAVSKILNGTDQKTTLYPTIREVRNTDALCTGTLISARTVLTAKRCTVDPKTGKSYALDALTFGGDKTNAVTKITAHPVLDIALLTLAKDAAAGPFYPLIASAPDVGARLNVFGYGDDTTLATGDEGADFLRGGNMTMETYRSGIDSLSMNYHASELVLSATNTPRGYQSLCNGDIGGPVLVNAGGKWQIAGVASFRSEDSCLNSREGHAVSIAYARRWIRKVSGLENPAVAAVATPPKSLTFIGTVFSALSKGGPCDSDLYTVYFERASLNDGFPLEINRRNGMVFACMKKAQAERLIPGMQVGVKAQQSVLSSGVIGDVFFLSDPYGK